MPTETQRLLELETQFMYQNDKFREMQYDIKVIKNTVTRINKTLAMLHMQIKEIRERQEKLKNKKVYVPVQHPLHL